MCVHITLTYTTINEYESPCCEAASLHFSLVFVSVSHSSAIPNF